MTKSPYSIIESQYITEKSQVLSELRTCESNVCTRRCESPKYVFLVNKTANKQEIAKAIEEIYEDKKIKVSKVNTLNSKPKKKRVRGRLGKTSGYKKAIVTLSPGDLLENI